MRCIIDTNIFLEVLLNQEQENGSQARKMLQRSDIHELFMSDFSPHSIVLLLLRRSPRFHTATDGGYSVIGDHGGGGGRWGIRKIEWCSRGYSLDVIAREGIWTHCLLIVTL
ncbi:MAG: hypothetical protein P4L55_20880 [Syntrophobacteraceae bacterium]|nr:hypothetical protein [Syntrophobacteraceae bacterium]